MKGTGEVRRCVRPKYFDEAPTRMHQRLNQALSDIGRGLYMTHVWALLGLHDVKQRYRRSTLGPFWLTLSMTIMIAAMGVLYARLFGQNMEDYLPFLAVGLLLWTFISTTLNELCSSFISADTMIKQVKLPLTVYVARVIWRNLLILAHNAVILVPVALWSGKATLIGIFSAVLGVAFLAVNALWVGLILGIVCTRFRDIPQIVASLTQIVFFLTPILWKPEVLGTKIWVAKINPIFHFVELVRAPVLTGTIPWQSWTVSLGVFAILAVIATSMLARFGHRVAYWV